MKPVDDHLELTLSRAPDSNRVSMDLVRRQRSPGAAFTLACSASGLEDKEIYLQLEIDAGTFSRIKKGDATLQADKEAAFCRAVGNTIYPEWRAFQIGCTLVMLKTEAERQRDEAEQRAKEAEAQVAMLKSLLIGRAA